MQLAKWKSQGSSCACWFRRGCKLSGVAIFAVIELHSYLHFTRWLQAVMSGRVGCG